MPRRCSTKGTLCSPVYCVVHPAAGLLHTELTPFILTEQFTFWDQPRYLCWQHHVSGQEPHTRVGKKRVGQEGCARGRDGLRQGGGKGGGGAAHRSRDPAHLCRRAGGARKGVCMRASEVCCRTCTRTPCRSTFRYIGSWAPSPWLLLGVHAERPSKASTFPRHVRRVRTRTEGTNSPKLDHIGLPSVPAASASPARQTSASANAIARRSVARGELRLGPHAARPRSNSLSWAILRVLVSRGNLFFVFSFDTQRPPDQSNLSRRNPSKGDVKKCVGRAAMTTTKGAPYTARTALHDRTLRDVRREQLSTAMLRDSHSMLLIALSYPALTECACADILRGAIGQGAPMYNR